MASSFFDNSSQTLDCAVAPAGLRTNLAGLLKPPISIPIDHKVTGVILGEGTHGLT